MIVYIFTDPLIILQQVSSRGILSITVKLKTNTNDIFHQCKRLFPHGKHTKEMGQNSTKILTLKSTCNLRKSKGVPLLLHVCYCHYFFSFSFSFFFISFFQSHLPSGSNDRKQTSGNGRIFRPFEATRAKRLSQNEVFDFQLILLENDYPICFPESNFLGFLVKWKSPPYATQPTLNLKFLT